MHTHRKCKRRTRECSHSHAHTHAHGRTHAHLRTYAKSYKHTYTQNMTSCTPGSLRRPKNAVKEPNCARAYVWMHVCVYLCVCDHAARHTYIRSQGAQLCAQVHEHVCVCVRERERECVCVMTMPHVIHTCIHAFIQRATFQPARLIAFKKKHTYIHVRIHTFEQKYMCVNL